MTLHYRTRGFVFKKEERKESDRNFTVFTKDFGRLEITAKAIRKINSKLRAGIDIFSLSEIEFIQGKNSKTLTDAVAVKKFGSIIGDFRKIKIAFSISKLLDVFIKGQEKDNQIFDLISGAFDNLENLKIGNSLETGSWKLEIFFYYFIWNFFSELGYRPEIKKCADCHAKLNPYGLYFSNEEGGVICKKCSVPGKPLQKINSDVIKILRLILQKNWAVVSKLKVEQPSQRLLKQISDNYYFYMVSGHSFK